MAPDVSLLARTREGSAEAFGELWRRHLPAAYAVAGRHRARSAPEDIVAEAAARVLALIRAGKGPDEHFRAYFLSAVRSVAIDQGRRDLRVVPTEADDLEVLADPVDDPFAGLATDDEGLALVREAFAGLSERDQRVLWHTTVEGAAPRAVAPALGMTANAVSVRAMRARESLRALYLDARAERGLAAADTDECRWTVSHLGALIRGRLPKRQTERAEAHVAECPHAAAIAADLRVIHDGFPALVVPLALLAGLGTPGFVSLSAVAGLSGAAGSAGAAGAAGAAAAKGGGAASSSAGGRASSSSSSSSGTSVDVVAQVASRVTGLVAGLAVSAGVAGALALPGASLAAPSATAPPTPTVTSAAPGTVGGSGARAVPGASPRSVVKSSPTSPTGLPTRTISASAIPSAVSRATSSDGAVGDSGQSPSTVDGTPVPRGVTPADSRGAPPAPATGTATGQPATPPTTTPPAPPTTRPPSPSPTPPAPSTTPPAPPAPQPGGAAPTITVRLVSGRDPARISVRVRSQVEGSMTVRISNASGAGTLSVRNSSWTCAQTSAEAVRCTGERGQALLEQSGTGGVQSVTVRVTDAAGDTWTETLRPT
ncbi:sigma-70 family RNA polymerase sigma factor [Terracoccus sp. 273MFTsu3.1]|uniref:sigma-70 family RNA polymerase sigma factor n=1 Tax=Terracoccus sp. 273MFTsu3.1 TaxID=1172188 RepID=UPI00039DC666|nr:sigma-70 family RNA polymerase sigma factor [Terracoccus sp. 273MFTsu3.1]